MTLLELPTNVMILICDYFLKNCQHLFAQYPMLGALQPFVQETYDALLKSTATLPGGQVSLQQWQENARNLDTRHDALNRTLYALLGALVDYTEDSQQQHTLVVLRDTIFPIGLRINRLSWAAEAGEAGRLHTQLQNTTLQQQLAAIRLVHEGNEVDGLTLAQAIVSVGQNLGEVLRQISQHQAESLIPSPAVLPDVSELEARRKFLLMIRALRENAQIAFQDKPEHHTLLWRVLEEQLARPSSTKKADPAATATGTDATSPDPQATNPNLPAASGVTPTSGVSPASGATTAPPVTGGAAVLTGAISGQQTNTSSPAPTPASSPSSSSK